MVTAPELIFLSGQCQWGLEQCGDGGHQDHYPCTKRVWGLHFPVHETAQGSGSLSVRGIIGQLEQAGGSLGNGLCLILLCSFICASVRRGLCLGVQETFCAGGDIKGWGCSLAELGNGGCCAGLHFKSHKMGFQKLWAQLQIAGLFLHYQSPSAGTFYFVAFCLAADISLQASKNLFKVSLLRVLNVLYQYLCHQDFPFSGIPCN